MDRSLSKKINIQYYALLREQRGCANEVLETTAQTPAELFEEIKIKYSFTLETDALQVAVNDSFADWSDKLGDGDAVVFIPPVAGG